VLPVKSYYCNIHKNNYISSHKIKNTNYKKQTITTQTNKQIDKMVNSQQLQEETSAFLNKGVLAVGIFDVSLTAGKSDVAPAAAGLAAGLITKQIQKKIIKNKNSDDENDKEYTMGNRMITGVVDIEASGKKNSSESKYARHRYI
jgi:hypothetical protein